MCRRLTCSRNRSLPHWTALRPRASHISWKSERHSSQSRRSSVRSGGRLADFFINHLRAQKDVRPSDLACQDGPLNGLRIRSITKNHGSRKTRRCGSGSHRFVSYGAEMGVEKSCGKQGWASSKATGSEAGGPGSFQVTTCGWCPGFIFIS
jgi:hypothetical protein